MHIILTRVRHFLARLRDTGTPADPLALMSPRDLADLPVYHPLRDRSPC